MAWRRAPVPAGTAVRGSTGALAPRAARSHERRNPATPPRPRLSRRQERALRAREANEGSTGRDRRLRINPGAQTMIRRHLLGLGVLVLTMIAGYVTSSITGVHEGSPVGDAPTPAGVEERPESTSVSVKIDSHIADMAIRYGLSKALIAAVIEAESQYNPRAISPRGAQGLMQLMPETAAILRVGDPFDPRENIEGGVRHLRSLMDRFDNNLPLALAAYNAGEQAVVRYGGVPPYRQTRQYESRIDRNARLLASPGSAMSRSTRS